MFNSSYETTAGSGLYERELMQRIVMARVEGVLTANVVEDVTDLYAITETGARTNDIRSFMHPLRVEETGRDPYWVIDLRPYERYLRTNGGKVPKDGPASILVQRALIEMYWNKFGGAEVLHWGLLPMVCYVNWLSGILRARLRIDPGNIIKVKAITAFFYLCQHTPKEKFGKGLSDNFAIKIKKAVQIEINELKQFLGSIDYLANVDDYINALKALIPSAQLEVLDQKFIYNQIMTSWASGADSRTLIATAVEFPPAFIAMIIAAGQPGYYKKTLVGQVVDQERNRFKYADYRVLMMSSLRALQS